MHWRVTPACLLVRLGLEGTRGGPWVPLPGASSLYIETGRNRTKAAAREQQLAHAYDMAEVTLERYPLVATAGLVWNTDRPVTRIGTGS